MSTTFREHYGPYALVAGASEGIGASFARQLAARGLHLVLFARREDKLAALADELRAAHGIEVRTASIDLAAPDLRERALAATAGLDVGLVVYNAAYSVIGPFLVQDLADHLRAVDVNCRGPVVLAHTYGQAMAARGRGGIILMTSLAGTQGTPLVATYGATKAFNLVLGEALWDELRRGGVDVVACRAGATRTPAFERSQPAKSTAPVMDADPVARDALEALGRGPSVIPGLANRAAAFFLGKVLSRRGAVAVMGRATRGMYGGR